MRRTNLKVVLVREDIVDLFNLRYSSKNELAHLVHGSLHAGAVVLCESLHRDIPRLLVRAVEVHIYNLADILERLPLPSRFDLGAEDAVPGLWQPGELIAVEAVECGSRALQHEQLLDLGADLDALILARDGLDYADLLAVAVERVRVRLAVDGHAGPAVLDNLNVCSVDVGVLLDEVVAEDGGKALGRVDGMLFCEDVDGLLLGVCGDDRAVVRFGVAVAVNKGCGGIIGALTRSQCRLQGECRRSAQRRCEHPSFHSYLPCTDGRCPCHTWRS